MQAIYKSAEYNELMKKLSQTTYLEAMGKQRSETIFSSIIQWIIGNSDFNKEKESTPLLFLLRLLAMTAVAQENIEGLPSDGKPVMDHSLITRILVNDIEIDEISAVETEVQTESKGDNGRLDIFVQSKINKNTNPLRIFIENKIDSKEGPNQCNRYYNFFKGDVDYENIFVFLSIEKPVKITDPHFIKITYQDLLDNMLNLIMIQSARFSVSSVRYLKDFIDTITSLKTDGNKRIAKDSIETTLKNFYNLNRNIIEASVIEGCVDVDVVEAIKDLQRERGDEYVADDDSVREILKKFYQSHKDIIDAGVYAGNASNVGGQSVRDAIDNQNASGKRDLTKYDLYYNGSLIGKRLNKSQVAAKAIDALANAGKTPEQVKIRLLGLGDFWSSDPQIWSKWKPENRTPVIFSTKVTYYVQTNIWDTKRIGKLKKVLDRDGDFELIPVP